VRLAPDVTVLALYNPYRRWGNLTVASIPSFKAVTFTRCLHGLPWIGLGKCDCKHIARARRKNIHKDDRMRPTPVHKSVGRHTGA
jgi:hypothetical protein